MINSIKTEFKVRTISSIFNTIGLSLAIIAIIMYFLM